MTDIEPGSKVKVTVTSSKLSQGAAKTLGRLFLKDPETKAQRRRTPKPSEERTRAGRPWFVRPKGSAVNAPHKGDTCELDCTLDVVRDLASVERYVQITKL